MKKKNSRAHYVRTREKSGSNSPPFQRNVQILPSPGHDAQSNARGMPGGVGMLKFRIDRRINRATDGLLGVGIFISFFV